MTGADPGPDAVRAIANETGPAWQVRALDIDRAGATVEGAGSPRTRASHSPGA